MAAATAASMWGLLFAYPGSFDLCHHSFATMWHDMDLVLLAANEHSHHLKQKRTALQLTSTRTATSVRLVSSKAPIHSPERVSPLLKHSTSASSHASTPTSPRVGRQGQPAPSRACNQSGSSSDDDAPFGLQQLQGIANGLLKIARLHA